MPLLHSHTGLLPLTCPLSLHGSHCFLAHSAESVPSSLFEQWRRSKTYHNSQMEGGEEGNRDCPLSPRSGPAPLQLGGGKECVGVWGSDSERGHLPQPPPLPSGIVQPVPPHTCAHWTSSLGGSIQALPPAQWPGALRPLLLPCLALTFAPASWRRCPPDVAFCPMWLAVSDIASLPRFLW